MLFKRFLIDILRVQFPLMHFFSYSLGGVNNLGPSAVRKSKIKEMLVIFGSRFLNICYQLLKIFRQKIHSAYYFHAYLVSMNPLVCQKFLETFLRDTHDLSDLASRTPKIFSRKSIERN